MIFNLFTMYLTLSGKIGRFDYFLYGLILPGAIVGGVYLAMLSAGIQLSGAPVNIWVFVISIAPSVKRLHDLHLSGWSVVLKLVPVFAPMMVLMLLFSKGVTIEQLQGLAKVEAAPEAP